MAEYRPDRPVIMSHGGHRRGSETYLKGQAIPEASAEGIPRGLVPLSPISTPAPAPVPAPVVAAAPQTPAPAPVTPALMMDVQPSVAAVASLSPLPPAVPVAPPADEVPTVRNRKDLFLLTKDQTVKVAQKLGVAFTPEENAKVIKEKVATKLGLTGSNEG